MIVCLGKAHLILHAILVVKKGKLMMEIKQFLNALKNILKNAEKLDNKDIVLVSIPLEDIPTIVDALEKQVPQQPSLEGDGYAPDGSLVFDEWICPCCNSRYEVDYDEYEYCPNCGQKITWEELKQYEE